MWNGGQVASFTLDSAEPTAETRTVGPAPLPVRARVREWRTDGAPTEAVEVRSRFGQGCVKCGRCNRGRPTVLVAVARRLEFVNRQPRRDDFAGNLEHTPVPHIDGAWITRCTVWECSMCGPGTCIVSAPLVRSRVAGRPVDHLATRAAAESAERMGGRCLIAVAWTVGGWVRARQPASDSRAAQRTALMSYFAASNACDRHVCL